MSTENEKDFLSSGMQRGNVDKNEHIRDQRTSLQKLKEFYSSPAVATLIFFVGIALFTLFGVAMFWDTAYAFIREYHLTAAFEFGIVIFLGYPCIRLLTTSWSDHLYATPFHDPMAPSGIADRGNFVIGVSRTKGLLVAFSKAMLMTHTLIFGGTGSGKSETLFSMLFNAVLSGSGGIFSDGKADANLPIRIYGITRRIGRELDNLTLSYIMGSKGQRKMRTPIARSNTMNPMVKGSASFCSEFMLSLMTASEGDNAIFSKRAQAFVKAYMRIMEYLRDTGRMNPFIGEFAEDISLLKKLAGFCADSTIPAEVTLPMRNYLITTGGTMDDVIESMKDGGQAMPIKPDVEKQHGFISMQLIEPLSILGQDYGHIFNVREYDIDMFDVMVNRRILAVLIPALEMSQESLQGLGKVVIASMKALLGEIMDGGNLTGTVDNIVNKRPTNSPMVFLAILDEVGYYMVPGIAVIPAQARSLGVGFVFAGQDKPAFTKLVDTEADSIIANTLIKMTGILEDETTGEIFTKRAGKTRIAETTGLSRKDSALGNSQDEGQVKISEVDRLDIRDLYRQKSGQFLIMNKDNFDFVQIMYTGAIKKIQHHQINQKVPMPTLTEDEVEEYLASASDTEELFEFLLVSKPDIENVHPLAIKMSSVYDVMYACLMGGDEIKSKRSGVAEGGKKDMFAEDPPAEMLPDRESGLDIFDFMDEGEVLKGLSGMHEAAAEADPDIEDDSEAIVELARHGSMYPRRKPFSGKGGNERRDSLLSKLKSDLNVAEPQGSANSTKVVTEKQSKRKVMMPSGMSGGLEALKSGTSAAPKAEEEAPKALAPSKKRKLSMPAGARSGLSTLTDNADKQESSATKIVVASSSALDLFADLDDDEEDEEEGE